MRNLYLAAGIIALSGCGQPSGPGGESPTGSEAESVQGVTADEIVLGTHTDLSGPTAIWGVGSINGVRMRFDEANTSGGVHGRQIRFIVEDAQYQVPKAIQAANKLMNRDKVFAMLLNMGTPPNNAIMTQQFKAGIPNLFPLTGAKTMVEPFQKLMFTQRGIYYDEMRAAVKYFVEQQGKETICAIYQDTDYGHEVLVGAQDQIDAMNLTMATTSAHKPTETEFTAAILKLRGANCDLVIMGTVHRDTVLILDAARKVGWTNVSWVGNNATYGQVIAEQESGEGYHAFVHMAKLYRDDELSPQVADWFDRYTERFGVEPGVPAMEGYRAADLTVKALEIAGPDLTVDKLVAAMESISDYEDIFGYKITFGPDDHKGVGESILSAVKDGRWVTLAESISY